MSNDGEQTKEHGRFHALKACLTPSKAYLIDSGASNHMVASMESFTNSLYQEDLTLIWDMTPKSQILREVQLKSNMMISRMYSMFPLP